MCFFLQVIVSFFVGGIVVTLVTLMAEKANEKTAGVIMMFPTTAPIGFIFLGIIAGPDKVAGIIPSIFVPLGMVVLSSFVYIRIANFYDGKLKSKPLETLLTLISTSLVWLIVIGLFVGAKFTSLGIGVLWYLVSVIITALLFKKVKSEPITKKKEYTRSALALRAVFVGVVTSMVIIIGKLINPFWGGIVTMYPAATMATLVILHQYYKPAQLYYFYKKAPIGSLSLFAYCLSIMWFYPVIGLVWGTLAAYVISVSVSFIISKGTLKDTKQLNIMLLIKYKLKEESK